MIAVKGSPMALAADVQQRLSALDANLVLSNIDGVRVKRAAALSQPSVIKILLTR